jgi:1-aminocyclopropane-1-carboxylate deaminase
LRFDTLHPLLMGNKWFKLLHNLLQMKAQGHRRVLTFGGAYSNHLFATAAAGQLLGIPTQAIVRGEPVSNPVLDAAQANGMAMEFWSRSAYREKHTMRETLQARFPEAWIIPEGGGNTEGIQGAREMWSLFPRRRPLEKRSVFVACGTGSTLAGLILGCERPEHDSLHGVAVLKGGDFLAKDIARWVAQRSSFEHGSVQSPLPAWQVHTQFHGGGYARCKAELRDFLSAFRALNPGTPVEHVYTGKLFWAIDQLLLEEPLLRAEELLALHTGGVYATS